MKKIILLILLFLLICLAYSFAEVPCKINYQGRLIENNMPVDGTKPMSFSIYDSAAGGDELWTSGNVDITVYNGLFRYVLGEGFIDGSPVADLSGINWTAGETLYLEVQVGADILTPREAIYAYPYAINSHLLEGATKEYFLNTSAETQKKDGGLNIMGNVGIGTTDPQGYKLYVAGDILSNTGRFYNADKDDYIEIRASDESIRFFTQDAEKLTILNSGRVGIGTTSPGEKLTVTGTIESTTGGVKFPDGTLQTTAPRAPTIEVINASVNTTYTRNHNGLVVIEAHYVGYQGGERTISVTFLVNGVSRAGISKAVNYVVMPSPTFTYSEVMSGDYTFRVNTTNLGKLLLQFVITKY